MELPMDLENVLVGLGVGKRPVLDTFFSTNNILSEMSQKIGVIEINCDNSFNSTENFICNIPGCAAVFNNLIEYESHYNRVHRYTCCECKKSLPSAHFLDLHVAETHDSFFAVMAEKTPSFVCYLETCSIKFLNPKERSEHCINDHKFPPNFRFDYLNVGSKKNTQPKLNKKKMNIGSNDCMEIDVTQSNNDDKRSKNLVTKSKEFTFCNSKSKSLHTNKFYSNKSKPVKPNSQSKLNNDDMLVEMKLNLPEC